MKSKRGFTLVEMLLVVAIIVILSGVAIIGISSMLENKKQQASDLQSHAGQFEPAASEMIENLKNLPGPSTAEPGVSLEPTVAPSASNATVPTVPATNTPTPHQTQQTQQTTQQTQQTTQQNNGGWVPPTATPTPYVSSTTTGSGSGTLTGNRYGGNLNISSNGSMIRSVTITFSSDVNLGSLNVDYRYLKTISGNTVTLTYDESRMPHNQPVTSLSLSNITWNNDNAANTISATYTIQYCEIK